MDMKVSHVDTKFCINLLAYSGYECTPRSWYSEIPAIYVHYIEITQLLACGVWLKDKKNLVLTWSEFDAMIML
jgi:hypothetical protein